MTYYILPERSTLSYFQGNKLNSIFYLYSNISLALPLHSSHICLVFLFESQAFYWVTPPSDYALASRIAFGQDLLVINALLLFVLKHL